FSIFDFRFATGRQAARLARCHSQIENRKSKIGFTLVEILVVIVIISVLSGMIMPQLSGQRGSAEMRSAAIQLYTAARYAHEQAVLRSNTVRLLFDTIDNSYRIQVENPEAEDESEPFEDITTGPIKPTKLPDSLQFGSLLIEPVQRSVTPEIAICFYSDGSADPAAIEITDGRRSRSLLVFPYTGRCEMIDGTTLQTPSEREDLDA
ncbi:MAG: GspH/FimT family pseudopilin, partial [Phycisphaeraceae bacterium]|nr:GspH/FimT family pseudopilin [Phycisphaeraceae bacterium]